MLPAKDTIFPLAFQNALTLERALLTSTTDGLLLRYDWPCFFGFLSEILFSYTFTY